MRSNYFQNKVWNFLTHILTLLSTYTKICNPE